MKSNTTKYNVMIDDFRYKNKKHAQKFVGYQKVKIMNCSAEATLPDIIQALQDKRTVCLAALGPNDEQKALIENGEKVKLTASKDTWQNQQLFGIDIDNTYKIRDKVTGKDVEYKHEGDCYLDEQGILYMCSVKGLRPAVIYETLSSKPEHRKYRVIFVMDKLITNHEERSQIAHALIESFFYKGYTLADRQCTDAGRLFFGASNVLYEDYDAQTSVNRLLSTTITYRTYNQSKSEERKKMAREHAKLVDNEMVKLIADHQWDEIKRIIAERVRDVVNLTAPKDREVSTKYQTISFINKTTDILFGLWTESPSPVVPRLREDFFTSAHAFPLDLLFDLPEDANISCILPGHYDEKPSAKIGCHEHIHRYRCFGCSDRSFDIFDLFEIFSGLSTTAARKKVGYVLNLSESTRWQKEKAEELRDFSDLFRYEARLEAISPYLAKRFKRMNMNSFLNHLIYDASVHVIDRANTGMDEAIYIAELKTMGKNIRFSGHKGASSQTLHKKLHISAILGLVEFISDEENLSILNIAKKRRLEKHRQGDMHKYRANLIKIPVFTKDVILEAERRLRKLDEQKFSFTYAHKRETFLWGLDLIDPNKHFVQDTEKNTRSDKTIQAFERFKAAAESLLEKQGYFTIQDILGHKRTRALKEKKELLAIVTPELLVALNINHTVYSSYYKELYQINQAKQKKLKAGRTKIFVPVKDMKGK